MAFADDAYTASVYLSLIIYGILGVVMYFIFENIRGKKEIFQPRVLSHKLKRPEVSLDGFFRWIPAVLSISDEQTHEIGGTDAYIFLRFVRFLLKTTGVSALLGFIILLPVYGTFEPAQEVGIQVVSMGNLTTKVNEYWASVIMAWVFFVLTLHFIHEEYKEFIIIRQKFLTNPGNELPVQTQSSCLVENIPKEIMTDTDLKACFETIYPGQVFSAVVAQNMKKCQKTIAERNKLVAKLESTIASYEAAKDALEKKKAKGKANPEDEAKLPMVGLKGDNKPVMCFGGEKVSAIEYFKKQIHNKNKLLTIQQDQAYAFQNGARPTITSSFSISGLRKSLGFSKSESVKEKVEGEEEEIVDENADADFPVPSSNGFVTFKNVMIKYECCQQSQTTALSSDHTQVVCSSASASSDYIWSNITFNRAMGRKGEWITFAILTGGVLFWGIIIAFIGAVSNVAALESALPFIASLPPIIVGLISTLLPVIVLSVFMSLLPVIFASFAVYVNGKKTISEVEEVVGNWGFLYAVANAYLLLFTGSLFGVISDAVSNPLNLPSLLGAAIPQVSVFFINFFIAKTFFGIPMMLSNIVSYLITFVYTHILGEKSQTVRGMLTGPYKRPSLSYGAAIPDLLYVLTVSLLYWIIAPVVTGVAVLYFAGYYATLKYQLLYVFVHQYQTGGKFFYMIYSYTMTALFLSSLAIVGFMGLKEPSPSLVPFYLTIPIPVVVVVHWFYVSNTCKKRAEYVDVKQMVVTEALLVSQTMEENIEQGSETNDKMNSTDITIHSATSHLDPEYYRDPAYLEKKAKIFPYRIDSTPLWDENYQLNAVYYDAMDDLGTDMEDITKDILVDQTKGVHIKDLAINASQVN